MSQAYLQFGAGVHNTAKHQCGKGDCPVCQVADGIGQVVAGGTRLYQGVSALLVDKDEGAQLLRCLPEGKELRFVEGAPIHLIVDHRPLEAKFGHRPFQLGDGRLRILHRQRGKASEAVGVVHSHLAHFVVAVPSDGTGNLRVQIVAVEGRGGGDHLYIHPQGVHISDALLRRPEVSRVGGPAI